MLKLLGLRENVKNLASLCKPYLSSRSTGRDLKKAYYLFLKEAQPSVPRVDQTDEITFLQEPNNIKLLLEIFEEDSVLDDFEQIFDLTRLLDKQNSIERVKEAIILLKEINVEFHYLIDLVINTIFWAPSNLAGGGSTSAAIGCIWVNLRDHWNNQDVIEFLIHETTHNLVFLDELVYTHYANYDELAKKENFSWSAILNKLRPLDKVFHSIVVSTEVLLFRNDHLGHPDHPCLHPPTEIMLNQTLASINYLKDRPNLHNLLSPRASSLLDCCKQKLATLESSISSLKWA